MFKFNDTNNRFSKRVQYAFNIGGIALLVSAFLLLPQQLKDRIIWWLGYNLWLYAVITSIIAYLLLKNFFVSVRLKSVHNARLIALAVMPLLLGFIIGGGFAIQSSSETLNDKYNPPPIEEIVRDLTARYEGNGAEVVYSPEHNSLVATMDHFPISNTDNNEVNFITAMKVYCVNESEYGRNLFLHYGYRISVHYKIFYSDDLAQISFSSQNGARCSFSIEMK